MREDSSHLSAAAPPHSSRAEPALVRLRNISKNFGAVEAVKPLDLDIHRGDFFAILGPSGCGKTTLLRMIGGFIAPTSGSVEIGGAEVTKLGPEMRPTNMVFQGLGLFPHMTVRQNIGYGLRIARQPRADIAERVREALVLVRLEELGERQIKELSGGQQQRVALARALVMRPQVLLLDEPLAALDLKLRQAMQEELRRIHHSIGGTFVFVTHDQGEALGLANVVAVMEAGVLAQLGSPEEIYSEPKTQFVSTFIGEANVFSGARIGGEVRLDLGARFASPGGDGPVRVVVRPEAVVLARDHLDAEVVLPGELRDMVFLGPYVRYKIELADGAEVIVNNADLGLRQGLELGARLHVGWTLDTHRVIDAD
jgi:ABC-type Fe3+/spermidine/putrescine transport system ATPase subunit